MKGQRAEYPALTQGRNSACSHSQAGKAEGSQGTGWSAPKVIASVGGTLAPH